MLYLIKILLLFVQKTKKVKIEEVTGEITYYRYRGKHKALA